MSRNIKTRIQHKHDIEANWLQAVNFVPLAGELIVYDADADHAKPRIKLGDGVTLVNQLEFITEDLDGELQAILEELESYTDNAVNELISCGTADPSDAITSKFYFKYSVD